MARSNKSHTFFAPALFASASQSRQNRGTDHQAEQAENRRLQTKNNSTEAQEPRFNSFKGSLSFTLPRLYEHQTEPEVDSILETEPQGPRVTGDPTTEYDVRYSRPRTRLGPYSPLLSDTGDPLLTRIQACLKVIIDQKGRDCRALDVRSLTDLADCFILVSGTSQRHSKGIADKLIALLESYGEELLGVSGSDVGEWIVVDFGDIVIHVFNEPMRQFYNLDELWSDARPVMPPAELLPQARSLETGMFRLNRPQEAG